MGRLRRVYPIRSSPRLPASTSRAYLLHRHSDLCCASSAEPRSPLGPSAKRSAAQNPEGRADRFDLQPLAAAAAWPNHLEIQTDETIARKRTAITKNGSGSSIANHASSVPRASIFV